MNGVTLKDLKRWVNSLPESQLETGKVVFRKYTNINNKYYTENTPIVTLCVDEDTNHIAMLDENSSTILEQLENAS